VCSSVITIAEKWVVAGAQCGRVGCTVGHRVSRCCLFVRALEDGLVIMMWETQEAPHYRILFLDYVGIASQLSARPGPESSSIL